MGGPRFGEVRALPQLRGTVERQLYRLMGVADPAHYLHHRILEQALDAMPELAPSVILDAGSGPGDHAFYLARRFPRAAVIGFDIDEGRVRQSTLEAELLAIDNVSFATSDLAHLDRQFPGRRFDLIVCIDVLEHIRDQRVALKALRDHLSPSGALVLHMPTARPRPVPFSRWLNDFFAWGDREHVAKELTAGQIVELIEQSGFSILRVRPTFGYWTGELATSLFAIPFRATRLNRGIQGLLAPMCRLLVLADGVAGQKCRYAVLVVARPRPDES